mmetsp:Transcript_58608/g.104564  ORF Transcript_58608/g.104564 Transcript_58608/m.104564 type:complete len:80 (+) Transcript_58608:191-430(+)
MGRHTIRLIYQQQVTSQKQSVGCHLGLVVGQLMYRSLREIYEKLILSVVISGMGDYSTGGKMYAGGLCSAVYPPQQNEI